MQNYSHAINTMALAKQQLFRSIRFIGKTAFKPHEHFQQDVSLIVTMAICLCAVVCVSVNLAAVYHAET